LLIESPSAGQYENTASTVDRLPASRRYFLYKKKRRERLLRSLRQRHAHQRRHGSQLTTDFSGSEATFYVVETRANSWDQNAAWSPVGLRGRRPGGGRAGGRSGRELRRSGSRSACSCFQVTHGTVTPLVFSLKVTVDSNTRLYI